MDKLYTSAKLGKLELKNRWIMLAMHTGYAEEDGSFSERDFAFYKTRAEGGVAAITLVGGVNEIGCQDRMHRLDDDRFDEGIRKVTKIIHDCGSLALMQLFHAGRNNTAECHGGKLPICPSEIASPIYRTVPKVMSEDDIIETIEAFASAAKRCKNCGVDCVEVSISAGYLLSQFLSPLVNLRNDKWGGSDEKRMRFPTEVLKAIRVAVGEDYTVIAKISGGDMLGGYELSYMVDFLNQLPEGTIDGVTVTGGWHEAPVPQISYHVKPGGYSYLAEEIKKGTGLPVIACNRINSGEAAREILGRGIVDFVGAARPFLADPGFAYKVKKGVSYNKCQGCNRGCIERVLKYKDVKCAFNPETGHEYIKNTFKKYENVLVVGAGPVGLALAKLLLERGSKVTVITDEPEVGGKLLIAAVPPFKKDLKSFGENLEWEIINLGGKILTGRPMSEEVIDEVRPDFVCFAVGAKAMKVEVPGIDNSKIKTSVAEEILKGNEVPEPGEKVVILGGGTVGLETAEYLGILRQNLEISVLEMASKVGKDLGGLKWIMMKSLKKFGVAVKTSATLVRANEGELSVIEVSKDEDGNEVKAEVKYPCDRIVFAVGSIGRGTLGYDEILEKRNISYEVFGDGLMAGNIMSGLEAAWEWVQLQ